MRPLFLLFLLACCHAQPKVAVVGTDNPIDNFTRVKPGMTAEQTAQTLGARGLLVDSSTLAGTTVRTYQWTNRDGSTIDAKFQNGKLIMIQAAVE